MKEVKYICRGHSTCKSRSTCFHSESHDRVNACGHFIGDFTRYKCRCISIRKVKLERLKDISNQGVVV